MKQQIVLNLLATLCLFGSACIRPQNYHPNGSVFQYTFPSVSKAHAIAISGRERTNPSKELNTGYYRRIKFYEAYIEFDPAGNELSPSQADEAETLIRNLRGPQQRDKVRVFVFVHGWKNNASETSGNVWAFRRMLNHLAYSISADDVNVGADPRVIGIYIGWPGAISNFAKDLTFWNREDQARIIGGDSLTRVLDRLLHAAKSSSNGLDYAGDSTVVLIGHSFGGLVLERAVLPILRRQVREITPSMPVSSPADLILLINEAAPAMQAAPFIQGLIEGKVHFQNDGKDFPLLVSMTSVGDPATKLAFPGSEFISPNRPKTLACQDHGIFECGADHLDTFGQKKTLPYNLLTAANMLALQSHTFRAAQSQATDCRLDFPLHQERYCIKANCPESNPQCLQNFPNNTPYWIMEMPQAFVPDHGSLFRDEVSCLVRVLLADRGELSTPDCAGNGAIKRQFALAAAPARPLAKPMLSSTINKK